MRYPLAMVATHIRPAVGYGGVAESTANLAWSWAHRGKCFILCSSDGSTTGRVLPKDLEFGPNIKVRLYSAYWLKRWGFGLGALWHVPRTCWGADSIYVNGIATWPVTLAALCSWLFRRPYAIAPRGGLMRDYVAQIRRAKPWKWAYYRWIMLPLLRRAKAIVVSGDPEAAGVRALLPDSRLEIIVNGVDIARWSYSPPPNKSEALRLCYVGRISPEKGINRFAEIWLETSHLDDRLLVAGDGFGRYAEQLHRLATRKGATIELLGNLRQSAVRSLLCQAHFLILASGLEGGEHENFGNVVGEALAVGRPVLVSRGLAWDHVEAAGLGFVFDRTETSLRSTLDKARGVRGEEYLIMCRRARGYAERHLDLGSASEKLWSLVNRSDADYSVERDFAT